MIAGLSDDENVRIMVEQMGFSEERARFIVAMERGEIEGDAEAIDGPLTAEDKKRLGIGSIFDAPTRGGGGMDPLETTPGAMERFQELLRLGFGRGPARATVLFEFGISKGDKEVVSDEEGERIRRRTNERAERYGNDRR